MAKEQKQYSLYLLAIVGIVAVVGIVLMISGKWSCLGTGAEETLLTEEGDDIAGMAFKVGRCIDNDAASAKDKNQYKIKSYASLIKTTKSDAYSGKAILSEATCDSKGQLISTIVDCTKEFGADYKCEEGACKPVCTPGPTGNGLCIQGSNGPNQNETMWNYFKEFKDSACNSYFDKIGEMCGHESYSCLHNVGCTPTCVEGDIIYACEEDNPSFKGEYIQYKCNKYYNKHKEYYNIYEVVGPDYEIYPLTSSVCPVGATCFNNKGMCP